MMEIIIDLLQVLDNLYCTDRLAEYEEKWQRVEQQIQQTFPGFTIAYAEMYNAGAERQASSRMGHVVVPLAKL